MGNVVHLDLPRLDRHTTGGFFQIIKEGDIMMPEWFEEWVIPETDNWHLKPDAPKEVQEAFSRWIQEHDTDTTGICVD